MILDVSVRKNGVVVIPLPIRSKFDTQDFFIFMPDVNPRCFVFIPITELLNVKDVEENLNDFLNTLKKIESEIKIDEIFKMKSEKNE